MSPENYIYYVVVMIYMKIIRRFHTRIIPAKEKIEEDTIYEYCCEPMQDLMWQNGESLVMNIGIITNNNHRYYVTKTFKFCPFCGEKITTVMENVGYE